jgi:hypothetical protein
MTFRAGTKQLRAGCCTGLGAPPAGSPRGARSAGARRIGSAGRHVEHEAEPGPARHHPLVRLRRLAQRIDLGHQADIAVRSEFEVVLVVERAAVRLPVIVRVPKARSPVPTASGSGPAPRPRSCARAARGRPPAATSSSRRRPSPRSRARRPVSAAPPPGSRWCRRCTRPRPTGRRARPFPAPGDRHHAIAEPVGVPHAEVAETADALGCHQGARAPPTCLIGLSTVRPLLRAVTASVDPPSTLLPV